MRRQIPVPERLIIAADFDPRKCGGIAGVARESNKLIDELADLGVIIKINSVLRALGYSYIGEIHRRRLKSFADLKLCDIGNTVENDAWMLCEEPPALLTVMCSAGIDAMMRAVKVLGGVTEVLGVTVLTSLKDAESEAIYGCNALDGVLKLSKMGIDAKLSGLILSPAEAMAVRQEHGGSVTLNTPNVRPASLPVRGDDQNQSRTLTITDAFQAGVDRIVVGRPILQAPNRREAAISCIEEIRAAIQ